MGVGENIDRIVRTRKHMTRIAMIIVGVGHATLYRLESVHPSQRDRTFARLPQRGDGAKTIESQKHCFMLFVVVVFLSSYILF